MRPVITAGGPMTVVLVLACVYAALVVGMYLAQDRLLYFPDRVGTEEAARFGLKPWPDDGPHLGFASLSAPPDAKSTFLVWHGNAGSAVDRAYFVRALERRGFRVLLLEYPGYGGRDGVLGEASFVAEGRRAARLARAEFGGPLLCLGESMGCAIATAVAAEDGCGVAGLVLITPWANLPDLAQSAYPFVPARWLVRDKYDNIRNLRGYDGPVAITLCDRDEVVPNRHTERLYESISSRKRLWRFTAANHNSWPVAPEERWWDEVLDFVADSSSRASSGDIGVQPLNGSA